MKVYIGIIKNTRPDKRTKESMKIAIKESTLRPKQLVNGLFQRAGGVFEVGSTSDFPGSRQQVKDLKR